MSTQIHGEFTFCPVCFPIAHIYSDEDRAFCFTGQNTFGITVFENGAEIPADNIMKIVVSSGRPGLLLFATLPLAENRDKYFNVETCETHAFEPMIHMRYAPRARLGAGGGPWVDAWRAKMMTFEELFAKYPEHGGFPRLADHFLAEVTAA